eukprot:8647076-Pyramimonas_sp.AAC.1
MYLGGALRSLYAGAALSPACLSGGVDVPPSPSWVAPLPALPPVRPSGCRLGFSLPRLPRR